MRTLQRNNRKFYYAKYLGSEPIKDEYGNDTLEKLKIFDDPVECYANISSSSGEESTLSFGSFSQYSRTIALTTDILSENDIVWFNVEPNEEKDNYNYVVVKVADSKNGYLVVIDKRTN